MITHGRRSGGSDGGSPVAGRLVRAARRGVDGIAVVRIAGGRRRGVGLRGVAEIRAGVDAGGIAVGSWSDMARPP